MISDKFAQDKPGQEVESSPPKESKEEDVGQRVSGFCGFHKIDKICCVCIEGSRSVAGFCGVRSGPFHIIRVLGSVASTSQSLTRQQLPSLSLRPFRQSTCEFSRLLFRSIRGKLAAISFVPAARAWSRYYLSLPEQAWAKREPKRSQSLLRLGR